MFAGTGGQSVDTGATSIMHTDFSHSGLSAIDADEGVDPVAEADVYMAYGRDAQAEEILQDALKADPARAAIHLKLLEIYAQRRNNRSRSAAAIPGPLSLTDMQMPPSTAADSSTVMCRCPPPGGAP